MQRSEIVGRILWYAVVTGLPVALAFAWAIEAHEQRAVAEQIESIAWKILSSF